jgi:hypothetical protein
MKLQHVFFSHFIITTTFNNSLNQTPILIQLIATKNAFLKLTFFQNTIVKNITIQNTHLIKKKKKKRACNNITNQTKYGVLNLV